jgi:hypothetical protein
MTDAGGETRSRGMWCGLPRTDRGQPDLGDVLLTQSPCAGGDTSYTRCWPEPMTAVGRESERRHDVDDDLPLPSLTDIPGTVVAEPDEQVLEAVYFDTAGLNRACGHITARHRGTGWTLSLPVPEDSPDEVRAPGTNRRRPHAELPGLCGHRRSARICGGSR